MKHTIICGHVLDVLKKLPDESVDTVITSPPYWGGLRDYGEETYTIWDGDLACKHEWAECSQKFSKPHHGVSSNTLKVASVTKDAENKSFSSGEFCKRCGAWRGQLGHEPFLNLYIEHLLEIMQEVKRVLKKTGVIFWNQGDTYASGGKSRMGGLGKSSYEYRKHAGRCRTNEIPSKSLCLQNERFIIRCIDELGFRLRDRIVWTKRLWISKTNSTIGSSMPTSANDRCAFSYEPVYVLVKSPRYYWDQDAIRTPLKAATKERVKHAFNPSKGDIQGAVKHTGAQHFAERVNQGELTGANRPNVWFINLEPSSLPHYAAFPSALVSSCLLAGCPRYVCKKCGRPKIKEFETIQLEPRENKRNKKPREDMGVVMQEVPEKGWLTAKRFLGWKGCDCNAGYDSGVVMDIFAGTGTVGVVAEQMGFNSIQIDLNKEYCEIAYQRLKPLVAQTKLGREPSVIERIGF